MNSFYRCFPEGRFCLGQTYINSVSSFSILSSHIASKMSSSFHSSTSLGDVNNTPENQDTSGQISPEDILQMEVTRRAPQICNHDFPTTPLFMRWKRFWNEKICLLWLRGENRDWPEIIGWFEERGISKRRDTLYSEWVRGGNEVSTLCLSIPCGRVFKDAGYSYGGSCYAVRAVTLIKLDL